MGTSGARPGRILIVAMVAIVLAAACGPSSPTSTPPAGVANALGSQIPGSDDPSIGPLGGGPTATPVKPPKPTVTPKPKPTACRGTIPSSITALEGPLRRPVGSITTVALWYV